MPKVRPMVDRIVEKLKISETGCHEFTGSLVDGYGYISSDVPGQSPRRVHVVMWVRSNGPIPKQTPKLCVLHKCDNRACCNPDHLFLGTRKENNDDMISKGRDVLSHKGEDNPSAKLKTEDVLAIRSSKDSNYKLAKRYKVSNVLIGKIKRRLAWRHV